MELDGGLQGSCSLTHRFVVGLLSRLTVHFVAAPSAELFFGLLEDNDDQQNYQQHADHRPKPHPSAHPSVCIIHHVVHFKTPFVTLRPTNRWTIITILFSDTFFMIMFPFNGNAQNATDRLGNHQFFVRMNNADRNLTCRCGNHGCVGKMP